MKELLKLAATFAAGLVLMVLIVRLFRAFNGASYSHQNAVALQSTSRAPSMFQQLSDYEIPAGSVLYSSNPDEGPAASIRTPAKLSVVIMSRTDLGPPSLPTWAQRSATLRCDGKFYLKVRSRQSRPQIYYVRPNVPYNPHLGMTWLQAKVKWPDPKCST